MSRKMKSADGKPQKEGRPASLAVKGLAVFLVTLMISAILMSITYSPWKYANVLRNNCTEPTTGIVCEDGAQKKEDEIYYYGPYIEYTIPGTNLTYRTKLIDTVDQRTEWKKGDAIAILYNSSDPAQAIFREPFAAEKRFSAAKIASAILIGAGFIVMIICCIVNMKKNTPKKQKFTTNAAGESYDEWRKNQLAKQAEEQDSKVLPKESE